MKNKTGNEMDAEIMQQLVWVFWPGFRVWVSQIREQLGSVRVCIL